MTAPKANSNETRSNNNTDTRHQDNVGRQTSVSKLSDNQLGRLAQNIKNWGSEMGFDAVGISDGELSAHESHLNSWLAKGMQGEMDYMHRHGTKRTNPGQ